MNSNLLSAHVYKDTNSNTSSSQGNGVEGSSGAPEQQPQKQGEEDRPGSSAEALQVDRQKQGEEDRPGSSAEALQVD
jgi:hypothetical protein